MNNEDRGSAYRDAMRTTHKGRRRYTPRQMKRLRKKAHAQGMHSIYCFCPVMVTA
jgi:hypothetical protein